MINVDVALLTGHDLRNDNIGLMRQIDEDDKATPHPQLVKLFEHYRLILASNTNLTKDGILYKASMAWIYSNFFTLYGERDIYREPVNVHLSTNETFYKKYLLEVDPLLIALSFNSVAYLWFCTEEYSLVKRIIRRLIFLSAIWRDILGDNPPKATIKVANVGGDVTLESHWARWAPPIEIISTNFRDSVDLRIAKLLPPGFIKCLSDVFIAYNLFKRGQSSYNTIPNDINWSVFAKICLISDVSIAGLIRTIKKLESIFFDPEFMFHGLKWTCTHTELLDLLKSDQRGYNNPNVWLLLCYLNHTGQLTIDNGGITNKHRWSISDKSIGHAMFDYFVYHDPSGIMSFLHTIQYKKNRDFTEYKLKRLLGLIGKYREYGLTLDPKKLKIKRGVLVNLLSAGFGDIFCMPL